MDEFTNRGERGCCLVFMIWYNSVNDILLPTIHPPARPCEFQVMFQFLCSTHSTLGKVIHESGLWREIERIVGLYTLRWPANGHVSVLSFSDKFNFNSLTPEGKRVALAYSSSERWIDSVCRLEPPPTDHFIQDKYLSIETMLNNFTVRDLVSSRTPVRCAFSLRKQMKEGGRAI